MAGERLLAVGVLAVQGDVREHAAALTACGAAVRAVRRASELDGLDGLVVPGGESSAMDRLLRAFDLYRPVRQAIGGGLPAYGSCAGMVMLADHILDGATGQETVGGLDVTVRRNAFGRQVDSFETDLEVSGLAAPMHAVFIRAPWIERAGADVEVLASVTGPDGAEHPVVVRQGAVLASSFHPELTDDLRLHEMFLDLVRHVRHGGG